MPRRCEGAWRPRSRAWPAGRWRSGCSQRVYNRPDSTGIGVPAGTSILFVLTMLGLTLVPHLMLEEKKNRTLEVMLVSPASAGHLAAAKALTGLFYTLLGAGIALAINRDLVVHWPLAIAALVAAALFLVAIGLWLGLRIEDRGQLTLWAMILVVPLLIPVFLVLMTPLIPAAVTEALSFIPTVVIFNLLRTSLADPISIGSALLGLAWVSAWVLAALALVAWQVRRQDRAAERTRLQPLPWKQASGLHGHVHPGPAHVDFVRGRPATRLPPRGDRPRLRSSPAGTIIAG